MFDHAHAFINLHDSFSTLSVVELVNPIWYLDSGAFTHMMNYLGILYTSKPHYKINKVIVSNDQFLPVIVVGSSSVHTPNDSLQLSNDFHLPDPFRNLMFVK